MTKLHESLAICLLVLTNACSVGTVTASTRMAGGGGGAAPGLGPIAAAGSSRDESGRPSADDTSAADAAAERDVRVVVPTPSTCTCCE